MTLLTIFETLFETFGFTTNTKGYKVLPPQVRVIQGDGVNYAEIINIYNALKAKGISAENLVLGMGGALLQKVDRDTQKFALKCREIMRCITLALPGFSIIRHASSSSPFTTSAKYCECHSTWYPFSSSLALKTFNTC